MRSYRKKWKEVWKERKEVVEEEGGGTEVAERKG